MSLVESVLMIGKNRHGPDRFVVSHQRHAAEAAAGANRVDTEFLYFLHVVLTNQNGLPRANYVLCQVIASRTRPLRHSHSIDDLEIKAQLVAVRIESPDVGVLDVKQTP